MFGNNHLLCFSRVGLEYSKFKLQEVFITFSIKGLYYQSLQVQCFEKTQMKYTHTLYILCTECEAKSAEWIYTIYHIRCDVLFLVAKIYDQMFLTLKIKHHVSRYNSLNA